MTHLDVVITFHVLSMVSQNKMADVLCGLSTGRYWLKCRFPMIMFINLKKGKYETYYIQLFLSKFKIFGLLSLFESTFCTITVCVLLLT